MSAAPPYTPLPNQQPSTTDTKYALQDPEAAQPMIAESRSRRRPHQQQGFRLIFGVICGVLFAGMFLGSGESSDKHIKNVPHPLVSRQWRESLDKCRKLNTRPGPPVGFESRTESDRFKKGTPPLLIRNATIWTGNDNGNEVVNGDILIEKGLIKSVGEAFTERNIKLLKEKGTKVIDAHGGWVTPGIFDMHSHIALDSAPGLSGASDVNSVAKPILPYLRSLDGWNTHDLAFKRSLSGGVTTALVLPGSANNIGGQAFVLKLALGAKTVEERVLDLPFHIPSPHSSPQGPDDPPRWRHVKMACGENIRRVYKQTRMDLAWNFRSSFEEARKVKVRQDQWCEKAAEVHARGEFLDESFPEDLEWEALVDVLRGKVRVNTHCYESTDFSAFIRHSNEFGFPIAAFHHAHEAWIVPELLHSANWIDDKPAVAIFATNARYKREAWRGTEYAPRILSENNITVIMKSDHPVLDSRFLLFEAQQAHHFGLPVNLALASVTSSSATTAGFGHRLGFVRKNYDADVVLWDSHPLALGATPLQVVIDGIPQLEAPFIAKPLSTEKEAPPIASVPRDPLTLRDDDDSLLPFIEEQTAKKESLIEEVWFQNVSEVFVKRRPVKGGKKGRWGIDSLIPEDEDGPFEVHVRDGEILCVSQSCSAPAESSLVSTKSRIIDLKGGSLLPPLLGFGPALGLVEIIAEQSTKDASVYDPLLSGELSATQQLWGPTVAVRAVDGLEFGGKHLRISYEAGVTKAVTAPLGDGMFRGVSVAFRTDAANVLEPGAVIKEVVALHVTVGHFKLSQRASISTQIAELRRLLLGTASGEVGNSTEPDYFALAGKGEIPFVINAWKADTIATIILLKREIQKTSTKPLKWIIHGGQEAHLVAADLAEADISVILSPPRAFPESWDERRATPGPPLAKRNAPAALQHAGVVFGLGVPEEWQARTLLWEAAWAQRDSNGEVSRKEAVAWLSSNLETILDLPTPLNTEFVAHECDPFEFGSRPVAASTEKRKIELFQ
ncbi:composite domain of metallo-dependent hydrolase [Meredithblackwellia eburnea MCA 4105]